ncbi:hypothetical protein OIU79_024991 [Salix purpurea]|uniref:Uncharacterized protein n=1 Tax=Salix purpurea TaxID=77065 RepID=A0A9Q0W3M4_SALPP|nr:hypothetical protein OIU79_024991 [Salix purpurea]
MELSLHKNHSHKLWSAEFNYNFILFLHPEDLPDAQCMQMHSGCNAAHIDSVCPHQNLFIQLFDHCFGNVQISITVIMFF